MLRIRPGAPVHILEPMADDLPVAAFFEVVAPDVADQEPVAKIYWLNP